MSIANPRFIALSFLPILASFFIMGTQVAPALTQQPVSTNTIPEKKPSRPEAITAALPNFASIQNTQEKKQQFFSYLMPIVKQVNQQVLAERDKITKLKQKSPLTKKDKAYLENMAKKYRVKAELADSTQFFKLLLRKVDQIPPSLVLAQAANESAWGTSRFAIKGNNLFGQWCFSKGCGLVPSQRDGGASHEVAKFDSVYQSVESYILNLNRHAEYSQLRAIRLQLRDNNKTIKGIQLADGLSGYSERGQDYVHEIQSMIRFNNLSLLDKNS